MKFTFAVVVLGLAFVQANGLSIRPSYVRPVVATRPIFAQQEEPAVQPCVVIDESELAQEQQEEPMDTVLIARPRPQPIDVGQIIRPVPVDAGNSRPMTKPSIKPAPVDVGQLIRPVPVENRPSGVLLLPNNRPLKPSDLIRPGQGGSFGGSGSSISTRPINQDNGKDQTFLTRPRPVAEEASSGLDQGTFIRPIPAEQGSRPIFLLPNDRPLKPSDLLPQQDNGKDQTFLLRPTPINQGNGKDQVFLLRPRPVAQEEPQNPSVVLLPNDRPLRPSDLLPQQDNGRDQTFLTRPRPVAEEVGSGLDQGTFIRPIPVEQGSRPIFLLPNDRPLKPSDLLPQQDNGKDQTFLTRPRPVVVEEPYNPSVVLLPNDRPLKPSDLLPQSGGTSGSFYPISIVQRPSITPTGPVQQRPSITPTGPVQQRPSITPTGPIQQLPSITPTGPIQQRPSITPTGPQIMPAILPAVRPTRPQTKPAIIVDEEEQEFVQPCALPDGEIVNKPIFTRPTGESVPRPIAIEVQEDGSLRPIYAEEEPIVAVSRPQLIRPTQGVSVPRPVAIIKENDGDLRPIYDFVR